MYHPHRPADLHDWEKSEQKCFEAYNENLDAIKYVKSKVMKYQDKVDEAQSKAQEEYDTYMADLLDPSKEQQEGDCLDEGVQEPETFMAIDPDDYSIDTKDYQIKDGFYKKINLDSLDYLCEETRKLDADQRSVVDIGVQYAQNIKKSDKSVSSKPNPPLVVVHGGAGCGKSFVINLMSQWQERIF